MAQSPEIEDVLSSIRRLVANDADPATQSRHAPPPARAVLVLAAEQRVTEPEDPYQTIRSLPAQPERDDDMAGISDAVRQDVDAFATDMADDAVARMRGESQGAEPHPENDAEDADHLLEGDAGDAGHDTAAAELTTAGTQGRGVSTGHGALPDGNTLPVASGDRAVTADVLDDLSNIDRGALTDDALRDMITEVVRQELAGALGERITRNVRRLVRREVRQMLSSGEFD